MLEKKPKTAPLRSEKSLMMVLLLVAEHEEPAGEEFVARLGVEVGVYYREGCEFLGGLGVGLQCRSKYSGLDWLANVRSRGSVYSALIWPVEALTRKEGSYPLPRWYVMLYFLQYVLGTSVMVACRLRRGIPTYLGAASDEVGGFGDAEGWGDRVLSWLG